MPSDNRTNDSNTAMMTTTASNSSSVKPWQQAHGGGRRLIGPAATRLCRELLEVPVTDIGRRPLTAIRAIGPLGVEIEFTVHPGVEVYVGLSPRVDR